MVHFAELLLSNALVATVLALAVATLTLFNIRPAMRHALWIIVLLKFVTPPLIGVELPSYPFQSTRRTPFDVGGVDVTEWNLTRTVVTPTESAAMSLGNASADASLDCDVCEAGDGNTVRHQFDAIGEATFRGLRPWIVDRLPAVFILVWIAGSIVWSILALSRLLRFHRHLGQTLPADARLQQITNDVARKMGLRTSVGVRVTDARVPPMLTTLRDRSVILLPARLLHGLTHDQQATVLVHELAHFRRGDRWIRWLEFIVLAIYWWHPGAWWARRQVQQAEEACCDAWVLRVFPDQAKGYAQALMAAVDFLSEGRPLAPAGASWFGHVHALQRRLEMILKRTTRPDLSSLGRVIAVAVAIGLLPWNPYAFAQTAAKGESQNGDEWVVTQRQDRSESKATTEERLDRLEKILGEMLERMPQKPTTTRRSAAPATDLMDRLKIVDQQIQTQQSQLLQMQDSLRKLQADRAKLQSVSDSGMPWFTTLSGSVPSLNTRGSLQLDRYPTTPEPRNLSWKLDTPDVGRVLSIEHGSDKVTLTGEDKQIVIDARTGKILSSKPTPPK